jgi:hypothetical protein
MTYIVGHGLNSLFCDCSGHVEIDMTLLHSGMFGKCEIGHGTSYKQLSQIKYNARYCNCIPISTLPLQY